MYCCWRGGAGPGRTVLSNAACQVVVKCSHLTDKGSEQLPPGRHPQPARRGEEGGGLASLQVQLGTSLVSPHL